MVLWLEWAERAVHMGHQALVEWDWGWYIRRDLRQEMGLFRNAGLSLSHLPQIKGQSRMAESVRGEMINETKCLL